MQMWIRKAIQELPRESLQSKIKEKIGAIRNANRSND